MLKHAEHIHIEEEIETQVPEREGIELVISQMDGSMVPIVETSGEGDRRRSRKVCWKEAKLALARRQGAVEGKYGGTIGNSEEAGDQLANSVIGVGAGTNTKIHCVGDGAPWIVEQVERVFAMQANYLIDFYHLCEYISAAADKCAPDNKTKWIEQQKERMKRNRSVEVLKELEPHLEPDIKKEAPVRACYRYIKNRPGQFNYAAAIASDLPIGSGEIESAHRYVIQKRLKIPGAWWKIENAKYMLSLRVLRANNDWDDYWNNLWSEKLTSSCHHFVKTRKWQYPKCKAIHDRDMNASINICRIGASTLGTGEVRPAILSANRQAHRQVQASPLKARIPRL
ncbi:MAG: hypothetical protein D6828_03075 [Nitrospirae bacterium]|nr:MAG: hypothetical protein D6828_03075 [Nitrospirota bacterium]